MSKRKVVSFLVAVAMIITSLSAIVTANAEVGKHASEVPNGYIAICDKADMLDLMNYGMENVNVEKTNNYILMADIVFEDSDFAEGGTFYNGGKGWAPLGVMASYPYSGTFDGNGYTISGLIVNNSVADEEGNCGFIGVNSGIVKNLHVKDSVMEVKVSGEPNLTYATAYGGGVVGLNLENGMVLNSSCADSEIVATSITVNAYAGGIVGYNSGTINNCFVANTKVKAVTASNRTDRTDKAIAGGVTGSNKNATMWNVMVTKDVTLAAETAIEKEGNNGKGMIVGESNIMSKIDGGYYPDGAEFAGLGNSSKAVCIPLTDVQYKQSRYFGSFDFTNVWVMGEKHPILCINGLTESVAPTVTEKVELADETPTPVPITDSPTPLPTASTEPSESPRPVVSGRIWFAKKSVNIKRGKKVILKLRGKVAKKAKFSILKGKKVIKLMKKKTKQVTVKGLKKGNATVVAKVASKRATCKIKVK